LSAPPDPLAAIGGGVPTSKGERREGNGKREERGWEGMKGREGREGEGRLASHTFLGPAPSTPGPRWGLRPPSPHHSEEITATE